MILNSIVIKASGVKNLTPIEINASPNLKSNDHTQTNVMFLKYPLNQN